MPRPKAVIVVGLGEEGQAERRRPRAHGASGRHRLGAALVRAGADGAVTPFELAATLIGSGGTGITAGQAAQRIAQGVHEANELLARRGRQRQGRGRASVTCA